MKEDITYELIARYLKAMADESRLKILHALRGRTMSVSEIVSQTGLTQSNVSRHLRVLKQLGLVRAVKKERNIFYSQTSTLPHKICELICGRITTEAKKEVKEITKFLTS